MKYVIEHHTADYRGDHSADIVVAIEPIEGESVTNLLSRTLGCAETISTTPGDHLVLRLVKPAQGAPLKRGERAETPLF